MNIQQPVTDNHNDDQEEEETKPAPMLEYEDTSHTGATMTQLNKLYKGAQFCDARLIVGDKETSVHRAVLASASGFFLEMFTKVAPEVERTEEHREPNVFKLKDVAWEPFSYLLDFIYTGRLSVPDEDVAAAYKLAQEVRVPAAAEACAQYLIDRLTPNNCLGIRSFASDDSFRERVDCYINSNIQAVTNSKKFYGLNKVTLEIVGTDESVVIRTKHEELLPEVLLWLKQKLASNKNKMEALKEDMIVLYLNTDNSLTDCADVEDTNLKDHGLVQDYKKLNRKKQSGKVVDTPERKVTNSYRKFNINPDKPIVELEWSILASMKTKDRTYITIAMMNGQLATLYIHYHSATSTGSASDDPESPVNNGMTAPFDSVEELTPLPTMSTNRCAFGLKALNGQLFACGGYDRGECLKSTEMYDMKTNEWRLVGEMKSPRGRFSIGVHEDKVYACGGSSGNNDVKFLECFNVESETWHKVTDIPQAKASPGIAVLGGKLYVLGGCMGQSTVATCEAYNPSTGIWESVPHMNMPRYQIAVTVLRDKIYAIGGTNGWKCVNEVEVYDPSSAQWSFLPPMNITRRGAGVDVYNGKIYVVGGNDGASALNSMEVYDPETRIWSLGPYLSIPRANCGVACLDTKLFAVGGFTGKKFLWTMEYLELEGENNMWSCYMPAGSQPNAVTNGTATNGDIQRENCDSKAATDTKNVRDLKSVPVNVVPAKACSKDLKRDMKMDGERTS